MWESTSDNETINHRSYRRSKQFTLMTIIWPIHQVPCMWLHRTPSSAMWYAAYGYSCHKVHGTIRKWCSNVGGSEVSSEWWGIKIQTTAVLLTHMDWYYKDLDEIDDQLDWDYFKDDDECDMLEWEWLDTIHQMDPHPDSPMSITSLWNDKNTLSSVNELNIKHCIDYNGSVWWEMSINDA